MKCNFVLNTVSSAKKRILFTDMRVIYFAWTLKTVIQIWFNFKKKKTMILYKKTIIYQV